MRTFASLERALAPTTEVGECMHARLKAWLKQRAAHVITITKRIVAKLRGVARFMRIARERAAERALRAVLENHVQLWSVLQFEITKWTWLDHWRQSSTYVVSDHSASSAMDNDKLLCLRRRGIVAPSGSTLGARVRARSALVAYSLAAREAACSFPSATYSSSPTT